MVSGETATRVFTNACSRRAHCPRICPPAISWALPHVLNLPHWTGQLEPRLASTARHLAPQPASASDATEQCSRPALRSVTGPFSCYYAACTRWHSLPRRRMRRRPLRRALLHIQVSRHTTLRTLPRRPSPRPHHRSRPWPRDATPAARAPRPTAP